MTKIYLRNANKMVWLTPHHRSALNYLTDAGDHISLPGLRKQHNTGQGAYTTELYFLTVLEATSPRSRCWQVFSSEAPPPDLQMVIFSRCPHMVTPELCVCALIFSSYKDTILLD